MNELMSFKIAFLSRCAEEGLTLEQINDRVKTAVARAEAEYGSEKQAFMGTALRGLAALGAAGAAGLGIGTAGEAIKKLWAPATGAATAFVMDPSVKSIAEGAVTGGLKDYLVPALALGGGALAGGGLLVGKSLAETQENPMAAEEIKHKELVNEYKRLTDRTRKATRRRRLLQN
jgi:hypothetical protein